MKMITNKLNSINLILASASPRRRELISGLDLKFEIAAGYQVQESYPPGLDPRQVAEYISVKKAEAYPYPIKERDIVVTADTTVILDGKIFGKPESKEQAKAMLSELSAKEHYVSTAVTLRGKEHYHTFSEVTRIWMYALSKEEIEYYVERYNPMDKAGAYAIQEWIGHIAIERMEGSFYNVMGFPVNRFYRELNMFVNNRL